MDTPLDLWLASFGSARSYVAFSLGGALTALALTPSMSRREAAVLLFCNVAVAVFAGPGTLAWLGVSSEPVKHVLHGLLGLTGASLARGIFHLAKAFENDPVGILRAVLSKVTFNGKSRGQRDD